MIRPKKTFVLSDESVNSYGFRVLTEGIDLTQFIKNPVLLVDHQGEAIGFWENIRIEDKQLLADPVFNDTDENAIRVAQKVEEGTIKGASIGIENAVFTDDSQLKADGQKYGTVISCVMFEASVTSLPANGNSLALYKARNERINLSKSAEIQSYEKQHLLSNKNKIKMNKETLTLLGLSETATVTDVHAAVVKLKNDLEASQRISLTARKNSIDEVVTNAFNMGKIQFNQTELYKGLLEKDFAGTKKLLDSIEVPESRRIVKDMRVSDLLKRGGNTHTQPTEKKNEPRTEKPADKSKWTLDHYRRFEPQTLRAQPELYNRLLAEQENQSI